MLSRKLYPKVHLEDLDCLIENAPKLVQPSILLNTDIAEYNFLESKFECC